MAARGFAVSSLADFVRHALAGESLLGGADERDFGNREDAVGKQFGRVVRGHLERAAGRDSALLLRSRREAGKADDVADREDVADLGLIILVGLQAPARV